MKKSSKLAISGAFLAAIVLGGVATFYHPQKALADSQVHVATADNGFNQTELNMMSQNGMETADLSSAKLAKSDALNAVATILNQFQGTVQAVKLVDMSENGRKFDPSFAATDPNVINDNFENIPCYLIKIHTDGDLSPSAGSPNNPIHENHELYVVVDATNGTLLDAFSVRNSQGLEPGAQ